MTTSDNLADIPTAATVAGMRDQKLRVVSLSIAVFAAGLSLASFVSRSLIPFVLPTTYLVSGLALVLFLRILFSRDYRRGIDAVNVAMHGADTRPGKAKTFSDPEWGLFGKRAGTPLLLWIRAILLLGVPPTYVVQHWTGVEAGLLWFASAFVVMELSIMHAVIDADAKES